VPTLALAKGRMPQSTSPMRKPKCLEPAPTDCDHWSGSLAQKRDSKLPFGIDVKHLDDALGNVVGIFVHEIKHSATEE
jgi:hypothetical protein